MADLGTLTFSSARDSAVLISPLGSGLFAGADHLLFSGPNGAGLSAVQIGQFQDTTFIGFGDGTPLNGEGYLGGVGSSGQLVNNKFIDINQVQLSGVGTKLITEVNRFDPINLTTEPTFAQQGSGTILMTYDASGVSTVNTFNAKMFAYDNVAGILTDPPDVQVYGYEINASGRAHTSNSGVWKLMHTQNDPLFFYDHSAANGYQPANQHIWSAGVSVKADSVGVLDAFSIAFAIEFA